MRDRGREDVFRSIGREIRVGVMDWLRIMGLRERRVVSCSRRKRVGELRRERHVSGRYIERGSMLWDWGSKK